MGEVIGNIGGSGTNVSGEPDLTVSNYHTWEVFGVPTYSTIIVGAGNPSRFYAAKINDQKPLEEIGGNGAYFNVTNDANGTIFEMLAPPNGNGNGYIVFFTFSGMSGANTPYFLMSNKRKSTGTPTPGGLADSLDAALIGAVGATAAIGTNHDEFFKGYVCGTSSQHSGTYVGHAVEGEFFWVHCPTFATFTEGTSTTDGDLYQIKMTAIQRA